MMYFLLKTGDFSACHVSFPVEASLGKIFEGNVKLEKTQVLGGLWMNLSNATGLGEKKQIYSITIIGGY